MAEPTYLDLYAAKVFRDAAVARRRSLARRAGGPLIRKYLEVVPFVFSAAGTFAAFRLRIPHSEALARLRDRAVLTLDSAAEVLGGFRFGAGQSIYAYLGSEEDLAWIEASGTGERLPGERFPLTWAPAGRNMLLAVVPLEMPPHRERTGFRVVTRERLLRDLIGLHGLRTDLLAEIEAKIPAEEP